MRNESLINQQLCGDDEIHREEKRKEGKRDGENNGANQSCVNCTICACVLDADSSSFRDLFSIIKIL